MSDAETTPLGALGTLLRRPSELPPAGRALLGALVCLALYGLLAGFFQGGGQILVAGLKAPLITAVAALICLPSFLVFHLVAGIESSTTDLLRAAAGFLAVLGLLLVALGPVSWLFSVTSRSLGFITLFHLAVWGGALLFGLRYLRLALGSPAAAFLWVLIFALVSLQLTAYLGPTLLRAPGEPLFELRRESFLARFGRICDETLPGEPLPEQSPTAATQAGHPGVSPPREASEDLPRSRKEPR